MRNSHRETITFKLALMKTVGFSFMFFTAALKLLNLRQGAIVTLQILFKNQIFLMKVMPKLKQKRTKNTPSLKMMYFSSDFIHGLLISFQIHPHSKIWPNDQTLIFFFFFKFLHEYILFSTPLFVCLYMCIYTNPSTHSGEGSALTY